MTKSIGGQPPTIRPFAAWLREQSNGRSHDELSEGLHDVIAKVRETGKKGSITYTITVAPYDRDADVLSVTDEIRLKLPEHDRKSSIFYPDAEGNLSRRDPNQLSFDDLQVVGEPNAVVDPGTGEITARKA